MPPFIFLTFRSGCHGLFFLEIDKKFFFDSFFHDYNMFTQAASQSLFSAATTAMVGAGLGSAILPSGATPLGQGGALLLSNNRAERRLSRNLR